MSLKKIIIANWQIFLIITLAAILRLWRLEALTTFGGDQGYDFLIIKKIIEGDFTLLGPKIGPYNELGNLYLGPAYYYLFVPALALFKFDPVGAAALTVFLSLATIAVIYVIGIQFFSKSVAILSSAIYSLNVLLIDQSRAPSNPHLIPFFAATFLLCLLQITIKKSQSLWYPIVAGVCLGISFQLHYLSTALLLAGFAILVLNKQIKKLAVVLGSFIFTISPQILFELRNDFFITHQFLKQFNTGQTILVSQLFVKLNDSFKILTSNLFISTPFLFIKIFMIVTFLPLAMAIIKRHNHPLTLITLSIIANVIFVSLYGGDVLVHYFASIYPAFVILIAALLSTIYNIFKNPFLKTANLILIAQIFATNFLNLNLSRLEGYTMPSGWNLIGIKAASKIIAGDVAVAENFNVASTLDGDTRAMPYRYFLEIANKKPRGVEDYPLSSVLYLISRDEVETIKRYTVWEVASFAPFEIKDKWEIQNGIKLYKLKRGVNY